MPIWDATSLGSASDTDTQSIKCTKYLLRQSTARVESKIQRELVLGLTKPYIAGGGVKHSKTNTSWVTVRVCAGGHLWLTLIISE